MKRSILVVGALLVALAVGALAVSRVAMLTQVTGAVKVDSQAARTLMPLSSGVEIQVPAKASVVVTFFGDGHRERLQGPCLARVESKRCRILQGGEASRQATKAAPSAVLAPGGENLRRMGGDLQASTNPASEDYGELVALVEEPQVLMFRVEPEDGGGGAGPPSGGAAPPAAEVRPPGDEEVPPPLAVERMPEPAPDPGAVDPEPEPPSTPGGAEPQPVPPPPPPPAPVPRGTTPAGAAVPSGSGAGASEPLRVSAQAAFVDRPVFEWDTEAQGPFQVKLQVGNETVWSEKTSSHRLVYRGPDLKPGIEFTWRVADLATKQVGGQTFQVLTKKEARGVEQAFAEAARLGGVSPWVLLMSNLADVGLYSEALRASSKALTLAPDDPSLHLARARLLLRLGRVDEARAEARLGIPLDE